MESINLRNRTKTPSWSERMEILVPEIWQVNPWKYQPPKHIIDMSLPPVERYQNVARAFKEQIQSLPVLFDEIIQSLHPNISLIWARRIARLFLRQVYSNEETAELKGIRDVTGIDMYLLVAFNVLLDLFMGCTSGGARVKEGSEESKMLHFRTLDWGMDPLQNVIVQL